MIVIDGENCVLGRVSTHVAKSALNGEHVAIVNAEKMIIIGNEKDIYQRYRDKFEIRNISKPVESPKISRRPDLFVKRTIRGMLPSHSSRKLDALHLIKAYIGVPKEFEGKGKKMFELKDVNKKHVTVDFICKKVGWKG
ncbi:50S ribosomal protein L13 [Candidatus Micrarchaeota archaeon]|nr:50S ribosomal protein L13 [Candidatus Micrarchaeota archaeon]